MTVRATTGDGQRARLTVHRYADPGWLLLLIEHSRNPAEALLVELDQARELARDLLAAAPPPYPPAST